MKKSKYVVLALFLMALFAFTALSQISPQTSITAAEEKLCTTTFYDEIQPVYGPCTQISNSTLCLNSTGPNTDCSVIQVYRNYTCQTDEIILHKNSTSCTSLNKFNITIDNGISAQKKQIDASNWGVCVNSTENGCLAITCGSQHGGSAVNGIFNGCDGGKSCQKFLFCQDGTKILYKASRNDFVAEDPTFHLNRLALKEVGK